MFCGTLDQQTGYNVIFFGEATLPINFDYLSGKRPTFKGRKIKQYLNKGIAIHNFVKYRNYSSLKILQNDGPEDLCPYHPFWEILNKMKIESEEYLNVQNLTRFYINVDGFFDEQRLEWHFEHYREIAPFGIKQSNYTQYYFDLIEIYDKDYFEKIRSERPEFREDHDYGTHCIPCIQDGVDTLEMAHEWDRQTLDDYLLKFGPILRKNIVDHYVAQWKELGYGISPMQFAGGIQGKNPNFP